MKKEINLKTSLKGLFGIFKRYGLTIFIIVLVGGLSSAVLILNEALQQTNRGGTGSSSSGNTSFDQATIDRVNQLSTSEKSRNTYAPPSGRINPFAE